MRKKPQVLGILSTAYQRLIFDPTTTPTSTPSKISAEDKNRKFRACLCDDYENCFVCRRYINYLRRNQLRAMAIQNGEKVKIKKRAKYPKAARLRAERAKKANELASEKLKVMEESPMIRQIMEAIAKDVL